MVQYLFITYTHPPVCCRSSLEHLQYPVLCECWANNHCVFREYCVPVRHGPVIHLDIFNPQLVESGDTEPQIQRVQCKLLNAKRYGFFSCLIFSYNLILKQNSYPASVILDGEKLNVFLLRSGARRGGQNLPFYSTQCWKSWAGSEISVCRRWQIWSFH
jgi:hypothetical protein